MQPLMLRPRSAAQLPCSLTPLRLPQVDELYEKASKKAEL